MKQEEPQPKPMTIVKKKADIKEHYADVFEGVGHFPGQPYHIQVDPKYHLSKHQWDQLLYI